MGFSTLIRKKKDKFSQVIKQSAAGMQTNYFSSIQICSAIVSKPLCFYKGIKLQV